uniref:Uncharacterized protein n=1 Tax=Rhizophora mucronata TaxID=61149 RepID=A0A2P2P730_RHIMU
MVNNDSNTDPCQICLNYCILSWELGLGKGPTLIKQHLGYS